MKVSEILINMHLCAPRISFVCLFRIGVIVLDLVKNCHFQVVMWGVANEFGGRVMKLYRNIGQYVQLRALGLYYLNNVSIISLSLVKI